jgi:hypothetical protein
MATLKVVKIITDTGVSLHHVYIDGKYIDTIARAEDIEARVERIITAYKEAREPEIIKEIEI